MTKAAKDANFLCHPPGTLGNLANSNWQRCQIKLATLPSDTMHLAESAAGGRRCCAVNPAGCGTDSGGPPETTPAPAFRSCPVGYTVSVPHRGRRSELALTAVLRRGR